MLNPHKIDPENEQDAYIMVVSELYYTLKADIQDKGSWLYHLQSKEGSDLLLKATERVLKDISKLTIGI